MSTIVPPSYRPSVSVLSRLVCGLSLALFLLSLNLPATARLWGAHHLLFTPPWVTFSVIACFVVLILSPSKWLASAGEWIGQTLWASEKRKQVRIHLLVAAACSFLFWIFRSSTFLLGDGQVLINSAAVVKSRTTVLEILDLALQTRNPLSTFIYFLASQAGQAFLNLEREVVFQLLSCIAGSVYVFLILRTLDWFAASPLQRTSIFLLLMGNGAIALFWGYVEYYPLLYLSSFAYAVATIRMLTFKTTLLVPSLLFVLTVLLHFTGIVLLPSLIYALFARMKSNVVGKLLQPKWVITGVAGSVVLLAALLYFSGEYQLRNYVVPVVSLDVRNTYTLFSTEHLVDILNALWLLAGPLFLGFLLMLRWREIRERVADNKFVFLLLIVFYQQLFVFLGNTDIGFARDWDVMLSMGSGILLLVSFLVANAERHVDSDRLFSHAVLRLSLFTVTATIPWIAVNASEGASIDRFESLLQMDKEFVGDYRTAYGYEMLSILHRERGRTSKELEALRRAMEASNNIRFYENAVIALNRTRLEEIDPSFLVQIIRRFHQEVVRENRQEKSAYYLDHLNMYYVSLRLLRERGNCSEALPFYQEALEKGVPHAGYAWLGVGQCLEEQGEWEKAYEAFQHVAVESLDIVSRDLESMGRVFLKANDVVRAGLVAKRALEQGSASEELLVRFLELSVKMGHRKEGLAVLSEYRRFYPDGRLKDRVAKLERHFSGKVKE
jgi:tetratricopeptide (TPR) repeat protein